MRVVRAGHRVFVSCMLTYDESTCPVEADRAGEVPNVGKEEWVR